MMPSLVAPGDMRRVPPSVMKAISVSRKSRAGRMRGRWNPRFRRARRKKYSFRFSRGAAP